MPFSPSHMQATLREITNEEHQVEDRWSDAEKAVEDMTRENQKRVSAPIPWPGSDAGLFSRLLTR